MGKSLIPTLALFFVITVITFLQQIRDLDSFSIYRNVLSSNDIDKAKVLVSRELPNAVQSISIVQYKNQTSNLMFFRSLVEKGVFKRLAKSYEVPAASLRIHSLRIIRTGGGLDIGRFFNLSSGSFVNVVVPLEPSFPFLRNSLRGNPMEQAVYEIGVFLVEKQTFNLKSRKYFIGSHFFIAAEIGYDLGYDLEGGVRLGGGYKLEYPGYSSAHYSTNKSSAHYSLNNSSAHYSLNNDTRASTVKGPGKGTVKGTTVRVRERATATEAIQCSEPPPAGGVSECRNIEMAVSPPPIMIQS